jgi:DNA-binding NarL/FixJ family response regulator
MTVSASDTSGRNACPDWMRITSMRINYTPAPREIPATDDYFARICKETEKVLKVLRTGKTNKEAARETGATTRRVRIIRTRAVALGIIKGGK